MVLPVGSPDVVEPDLPGPPQPVVPEPITDGGGDRLVVVTPAAAAARPSATLLAAQQLSEEADRYVHRSGRRTSDRIADRRHRATRALIEQRRADRMVAAGS